MSPRDIAIHRLINQRIAFADCKGPGEVVASLCAMQAQDYAGALWAVGLRLPEATVADVEQAIADRTIVRTWLMRGTLHFVAAADVRWMLELLTPRIVSGMAGRHRQLELDDSVITRSKKLFVRTLRGGKRMTRDAMYESLERSRISTAGQRGYHILWRLAQDGVLCFGNNHGKQPAFVLLDEWLPKTRNLDRDEALAELARRYFTSHGPATLQDFVWWSGLKVSDAKAGLDMVSSQLAREAIDGKIYWMSHDMPAMGDVRGAVYLLPGFDEYILGYTDRSASLDPRHFQKIVPGNNGMFMPTIVINGRAVGTWKRIFKKNAVVITANPFTPLNKGEIHAFTAAAERYARFLGMHLVFSK